MTLFRNLSIKKKLLLIIAVTSISTVILGFSAYMVFDIISIKKELKKNALLNAKLISQYAIAPLIFNYPEEAEDILAKLSTMPSVLYATITDKNDYLFAQYQKSPSDKEIISTKRLKQIVFKDNSLYIFHEIKKDNKIYGHLYMRYSDDTIRNRIYYNLTVILIIVPILLLLIILFAFRLQKIISEPIHYLANITKAISEKQDLSIQIIPYGNDEIGILYKNFNELIKQLSIKESQRDKAEENLRLLNQELEEKIKIRTHDLLKAKDIAEKATLYKSEFLAKMSHEIRTPLGAVIGLIYLLEKTKLDKQQFDYVKKTQNSANHLLQVINEILDFTKIESGKIELESTEFSLKSIIQDLCNYASINSLDKEIEVLLDNDPNIPNQLIGDPLRLKQILLNLISNAIKFTEKGSIIIKLSLINKTKNTCTIEFSVIDTGIGIKENQLSKLFQDFTQADMTTTRKYGGTGLGLSISNRFITMMGGKIEVKSEFGKGSNFMFSLQFPISSTKPKIEDNKLPKKLHKINLLLVDNNKLSREVMEKYLTHLGLEYFSAKNEDDAYHALQKEQYDVLFFDAHDKNKNNYDFIKQLNSLSDNKPNKPKIIVVTRLSDERNYKELDYDIDNILIKPINESILFDTIVSLFENEYSEITKKQHNNTKYPKGFNQIIGAKILVAEDDLINQQIIFELLNSEGFEVIIASNGKECIEKFATEKNVDLILMDIQMPEMDGIEATKYIRENYKNIAVKIVALSADVIAETRVKIQQAGIDDYLTKPIDVDELFKTLLKWIPAKKTATQKTTLPVTTKTRIKLTDTDEISYSEGLTRVANNKDLYIKLLKDFVKSQQHLVNEITEFVENSEFDKAREKVHKLKGASGNLGLKKLHKTAEACQKLIEEKTYNTALANTLTILKNRLSSVTDKLQKDIGLD
ncbi:MAG: response regulator [Paludibacteraceae bacterium]|nr:response regulator [Paludibacteraceae bacterium]MBN2786714.1 response regulator [Paludibacteraceae bacterium]